MTETRTVEQALERFKLINGAGDQESTACVMTAISWIAGEAWSDHPACAHKLIADLAIRANDADGTTPEQRADIVRGGAGGGGGHRGVLGDGVAPLRQAGVEGLSRMQVVRSAPALRRQVSIRTGVPSGRIAAMASMSALFIRMQPWLTSAPTVLRSLVPWIPSEPAPPLNDLSIAEKPLRTYVRVP